MHFWVFKDFRGFGTKSNSGVIALESWGAWGDMARHVENTATTGRLPEIRMPNHTLEALKHDFESLT